MAYTNICGKKLRAKMGAVLNESATSHSPALLSADRSFAKRQLEKMGWAEGTGLGKRRDGRREHVKIKQREDELGLGRKGVHAQEMGNAWWKDSVGGTLARLQQLQQQNKKKKKGERADKKRKKDGTKSTRKQLGERNTTTTGLPASATAAATAIKTFTDEELFEATGGARFGMRAQRRAEGKWKRTETGTALAQLEEEARAGMEWDGWGSAQAATTDESRSKKKRMREDASGTVDEAASPSITEEECREEPSEDETRSVRKTSRREKRDQYITSEKERRGAKKKKRKKKKKKQKRNKGTSAPRE